MMQAQLKDQERQLKPVSLEVLLVVMVFVLAFFLRVGRADISSFASDEARLSLLALETAREGKIAPVGITSSASIRNFPASAYVFVPPYSLSTSPLFATQYMGLMSFLAVVGVWALARWAFGTWQALAVALLFATMPFNVLFSRSIWAQNWLAPLAVAWLVLMYWAIRGTRGRFVALVGATFIAGLAFQVHLAGIALALAHGIALVRFGLWRMFGAWVLGGMLAMVFLLPFISYALCCAPEVLSDFTGAVSASEPNGTQFSSRALDFGVQMALHRHWDYRATGDYALGQALQEAFAVGIALLYALGAAAWWQMRHQREKRVVVEMALLLLITPLLVFSISRGNAPARLHYLLMGLPALALLGGASVGIRAHLWLRASIGLVVLVVGMGWSYQLIESLHFLDEELVMSGMGMSLEAVQEASDALPKDRELIILTQSDDSTTRGEPATWEVLLYNTPHRILDGWRTLILPPYPVWVVSDVEGMPAWEEAQFAGLANDVTSFSFVGGAPLTSYFAYNATLLTGYNLLETPMTFDSGLELIGWQQRVISGRLRVSTVYRVLSASNDTEIQQFTHLRTPDMQNEPPLNGADIPLSARHWRVGDTVIGIADFFGYSVGDTYTLTVGHYDLASGARYGLENGQDSVFLGEFVVK